jgi:hypothetical protein
MKRRATDNRSAADKTVAADKRKTAQRICLGKKERFDIKKTRC